LAQSLNIIIFIIIYLKILGPAVGGGWATFQALLTDFVNAKVERIRDGG
jgi:hypothetical protein